MENSREYFQFTFCERGIFPWHVPSHHSRGSDTCIYLKFWNNSGWFFLPKRLWFRSVLMPWFWFICPRAPRQGPVGIQVSFKRRNIWGIQEITCEKNSFLSHGRTRHSRGWGTLAPGSCRGLGGGTNRKENWNGSVNICSKVIQLFLKLFENGPFRMRWFGAEVWSE